MITLAEQDTLQRILTDAARGKSTEELQATYREGLALAAGTTAVVPWQDAMAAVTVVLRERIVADWLHANWCPVIVCPAPDEHLASVAAAAREVVVAFDAGRGLTEATYAAMWPHNPPSAYATADLSSSAVFQKLIADLVTVVPAESEVTA